MSSRKSQGWIEVVIHNDVKLRRLLFLQRALFLVAWLKNGMVQKARVLGSKKGSVSWIFVTKIKIFDRALGEPIFLLFEYNLIIGC